MGLSAIKRIVPSPKHSHTQKRFLLEAKEKGKRIIAGETVNLASYIMLNVRGALEEIRFKNAFKNPTDENIKLFYVADYSNNSLRHKLIRNTVKKYSLNGRVESTYGTLHSFFELNTDCVTISRKPLL